MGFGSTRVVTSWSYTWQTCINYAFTVVTKFCSGVPIYVHKIATRAISPDPTRNRFVLASLVPRLRTTRHVRGHRAVDRENSSTPNLRRRNHVETPCETL